MVTDSGYTTLDSLSGQEVLAATQKKTTPKIVKDYPLIKLYSIMSTRQRELGNEANLIMLNNQPRVVVTDSGCTTLDSLRGQEVLAATQKKQLLR